MGGEPVQRFTSISSYVSELSKCSHTLTERKYEITKIQRNEFSKDGLEKMEVIKINSVSASC